jgi:hypothetical protein
MKPYKLIIAGFLVGLGMSYAIVLNQGEVNYLDRELYEDQELDNLMKLEVSQEE